MIKCKVCNESITLLLNGYPLYYFGAGPNNPQDAKEYFCGAVCSNIRHKEIKRV
jgi:hypothetical protein